MKDKCYIPNGELQGDNRPMPNRGTGTGVGDTYGADISPDATNREGGFKGRSHPVDRDMPVDPQANY
ncbi:hypothetical protein [Pseudothauera rhizosphaerae]|uniref:Uncharacterized protein n=1 Tax=Pseudothauera rhizosphaerae TaxID=2565932 RepID=A0A4S4AB92_9RHOO|nr:hypothetical protein [Pseudothauera rhizosphaerae]THF55918.1 hypothetical protein E6O51_20240 [Pseudothauera rhizosphaerae]